MCAAALLLGVGTAGSAQVVDTPEGTVEFIGLQSWTVQMIRDSMAVHAPDKPLGQCAGELVALGFPSAQALDIGGKQTVVLVVDPAHAGKIQPRRVVGDSASPVRWPELTRLDTLRHGHALGSAVVWRHIWYSLADTLRAKLFPLAGTDRPTFQGAIDALERADGDRDAALHAIERDGNFRNRRAAAYIIAGSPMVPSSWTALTAALLDEDQRAAEAAVRALESMLADHPPAVDWSSRRIELRSLAAGTNVFVLRTVFSMLQRTGSPGDARAALAQNGHMVIALLGSAAPDYRDSAHAFLRFAADGQDLGLSRAQWERWIEELPTDG